MHSADGVFGRVYKEAPLFKKLISPEIHERRRRISSGVCFRNLGKVFFFTQAARHGTPAAEQKVKSGCRAVGSAGMSHDERPKFYRQEVNKTIWEVPERYQNLSPVGSGAYGSVW